MIPRTVFTDCSIMAFPGHEAVIGIVLLTCLFIIMPMFVHQIQTKQHVQVANQSPVVWNDLTILEQCLPVVIIDQQFIVSSASVFERRL